MEIHSVAFSREEQATPDMTFGVTEVTNLLDRVDGSPFRSELGGKSLGAAVESGTSASPAFGSEVDAPAGRNAGRDMNMLRSPLSRTPGSRRESQDQFRPRGFGRASRAAGVNPIRDASP